MNQLPLPRAPQRVYVFAHLLDPTSQRRDFVPAGVLTRTRTEGGAPSQEFSYGQQYLKRANAFEVDPLALGIAHGEERLKKAFFPLGELGEFGGVRDAAPDAWGRRVIEAKLRVPANSLDELTYLLHAGSDRVGALDVRESLSDGPRSPAGLVTTLAYLLQAAELVEAGEPVPTKLQAFLDAAPSAGGARPKASVRDANGVLWLAKFPARTDALNMAVLEAGALQLAGNAGLTVPPVELHTIAGKPVMLVRRFDRYWAPVGELMRAGARGYDAEPQPGWQEGRLPQVSALTLLGCSELESPAKSYKDMAHAIQAHVLPSYIASDKEELFARMVFNIFVTNDDDHLRNHAFNHDPTLRGWRLSPLYDVVPRALVSTERFLHLGVGQMGRLATLDNALSEYTAFVNSRAQALAIIGRVWGALRGWKNVFEALGADQKVMDALSLAIRPLEAIASPELVKEIRKAG